jgi:hypothetical protein
VKVRAVSGVRVFDGCAPSPWTFVSTVTISLHAGVISGDSNVRVMECGID